VRRGLGSAALFRLCALATNLMFGNPIILAADVLEQGPQRLDLRRVVERQVALDANANQASAHARNRLALKS